MYELRAWLNLKNGEKQEYHVTVKTVAQEGIRAVYLDAFAEGAIDGECGAVIEFCPKDLKRFVTDYRCSEFWCGPGFGTEASEIPDETQGLIYEKKEGGYGVILPVVSGQYKCVLAGTASGKIQAKLFSWYEKLTDCRALAFVYAEGENPYLLLEQCAETGMRLLNNGCRTRKERRYPELFEYLGWCSWDAFEIRVDEEGLLKKCREFKEKQIPVKWVILDDMWAEVRDFYGMGYADRTEMCRLMHASRLYSFRADPKRFPNGLKGCIEKLKEYGMAVGIWHPTTGYWMGIDPAGEIYRDYKACLLQTEDGRWIPDFEQGKAYRFYHAFHEYLRQCGAEFVKIDNQSMTRRFYKKLAPVGEIARQFHNAMEASVGQHFDNQMINCMGMASEDMWNRSVSPIARCSNDFQPEDRAWFTGHVLQCAYNCLIQGQFYYCDWDMWWSDDGQAEKNSIIRAVSGGPVYVSDTLNRSRQEVLKRLVLSDGRLLRCDRPGMPSRDCLTHNPVQSGRLFKLQNKADASGVLAVFNLDEQDRSVSGSISPSDVEGLQGDSFAVYEHFSRECRILGREESFELTLGSRDDYRLYVLVPLVNGYAMIGRTDKYISPKTVRHTAGGEELVEAGEYAYVRDGKLHFEAAQKKSRNGET